MAYAVHFRFKWQSDNDNVYQIDILEDGYSGSIVKRPLGGAPQLRRNKNGNICGTSLEFQAQAQVDGEFACLFAVSATAYRVDLYRGSSLIWQGFITPELYSEPYIAPPYNVRVTATDNLGELKLSDYTAQGRVSVATLLSTILAKTGLSFSVHWLSAMHPSSQASVTAANMPAGTLINLDHLEGETCYDVLTKMLDTFHAFIVQHDCSWLIVRETDLEALRSDATITAPDGTTFSIGDFGSMSNKIWWPVGYLSQTVVAAKKKKVITAPNAWVENLLSLTPSSSENATLVTPTDGSTPYYELTPWTWNGAGNVPGSASLTVQTGFDDFVPVKDLTLRLTMQFWGILVNISGMTAKHGKCGALKVKLTASDGSSYIYRWLGADGSISTTEVEAMSFNDSFDEVPQDIYLNIPVLSKMSEGGWTRIYQIQVTYTSYTSEGTVTRLYIYTDWNLNIAEQNKGYQVTCLLNNGARGEAEETTIAAADNTNKNLEKLFVQNGFKYSNTVSGHYLESIAEWASSNILSMPLLEFLARDYCLSIAVPRLRMEGTMNVPASTALPLLFRGGGLIYWPETWDWNLETDRLDISMLSLPASAITVTSVTRTAQGSGGVITGGGGTPSGGGGGGGTGDGTVTSVAVTVPTGLTVTGSPITTNGTIAIALAEYYTIPLASDVNKGVAAYAWGDHSQAGYLTSAVTSITLKTPTALKVNSANSYTITSSGTFTLSLASGYVIPTQLSINDWNAAATNSHTHSNKTVLDGITSTKVSNWDTAYSDHHTHSNKSTLDGITSGKPSNWDSAYAAAVTNVIGQGSGISGSATGLVNGAAVFEYVSSQVNVPYPTSWTWTQGGASGPTATINMANTTTNISVAAIPSASYDYSGIVTTGTQTFKGAKSFFNQITASAGIASSADITVTGGSITTNRKVAAHDLVIPTDGPSSSNSWISSSEYYISIDTTAISGQTPS
jgi:hypothetical protein